MGLRRRLFAIQAATLAIVTLGAIGGWGLSTLLSRPSDQEAARLERQVDHLSRLSFDLLAAFPNTGLYLLQGTPAKLASLLDADIRDLERFRRRLDEHLATSLLTPEDAAVHRELETIRLLSIQAEGTLQRTRQEALSAAGQGRQLSPAILSRVVEDPSLTVMRRHSDLLSSLHDSLDTRLTKLTSQARQAGTLGLTIGITMLLAAWVLGLFFAWRTANRILKPLLGLEQLMRTAPMRLPSDPELQAFEKAPAEIASLSNSFQGLVNEVRQLLGQLEDQLRTDQLTSVGNRRRFEEALESEWRRGLRQGESLSLLLLDVDHFKRYNDHFGHPQGDDCLRRVAAAVAAMARRSGEQVCRIGGEEFAVLLPGAELMEARELAMAIVAAIDALAIDHPNSPVAGWVTASIGVAGGVPMAHLSSRALVQKADDALYRRKRQMGRHGVCVAEPWASKPGSNRRPWQPARSLDDDAPDRLPRRG